MTHAVCCDIADPILAWRNHAQIAGRSSISDDMLTSRVDPSGTVNAALALPDAALLQVAGQLVAQDPALLQPARVADPTWRAVWLSAIEAGADPWSVAPAAEAVPQLLGALMEGESVSDRLLNAAAESDGADLSGYPRRARVWEYLPLGIRDRFLERTARALALSPTDQLASLEPDLIVAILRPENLEAIALLGVDRAVDVLEQLADHVTSKTVLAVTKGPKLPADCSSRLGHLVVSRELKEVAKRLAQRAKNRPDLRLAATIASVLLSLSDRVTFMLRVRGVTPTADEIQHLAHELMVKLYIRGPMDRSLWARSGGDPADLSEAPTPRERWSLAADAIATRARGAPALSVMLDVMIEPGLIIPQGEPLAIADIREAQFIKEGDLFLMTDEEGNLPPAQAAYGLYRGDTRHLSVYDLTLDDVRPTVLLSTAELGFGSEQHLTNPRMTVDSRVILKDSIEVTRRRVVNKSLVESIRVTNFAIERTRIALRLRFAADFADMFEVRGETRPRRGKLFPPEVATIG